MIKNIFLHTGFITSFYPHIPAGKIQLQNLWGIFCDDKNMQSIGFMIDFTGTAFKKIYNIFS